MDLGVSVCEPFGVRYELLNNFENSKVVDEGVCAIAVQEQVLVWVSVVKLS